MPNWKRILVHHSAAPDKAGYLDFDGIRRHHIETNGWADIGYHFIVEHVGTGYRAIAARPLTESGAHCPGQNSVAIGVCFVGNFMDSPPPHEQLVEGSKLIAGLCLLAGIDPVEIEPHKKFRSTECPGDKFPMDELRTMVRLQLR